MQGGQARVLAHCNQSGFGLVDISIAILGISILAVAIQKIVTSNLRSVASLARLQDLESLKQTVRESLSCERTVGLNAVPLSPVPCGGPYTLRRDDGRELIPAASPWQTSAQCLNDVLIISVESKEPDPLLQQVVRRADLFEGASSLCNRIFTSAPLCGKDEVQNGFFNGTPLCTKAVLQANAGFYWTKTSSNTDGPRCIISNEFSKACSCPAGSNVLASTSTSLYRQWTNTVYCRWQ